MKDAWVVSIHANMPNLHHLHYVIADNELEAQVIALREYAEGLRPQFDRRYHATLTLTAQAIDGGAPDGR